MSDLVDTAESKENAKKKILDISVMDKMKNEELRRSGMGEAATEARRLKWSWDVRVARMDLDRWGLRRNYVGPETRKKVQNLVQCTTVLATKERGSPRTREMEIIARLQHLKFTPTW